MAVKPGNYVIFSNLKGRKHFGKVLRVDKEEVKVRYEETSPQEDEQEETIPIGNVVLRIPPPYAYGKVHGCLIEPYRETIKFEHWGLVHSYRKMDAKQHKILLISLKSVYKKLKKESLHQNLPLSLEVRHARGKVIGLYKTSKSEGVLDTLTLMPKEFNSVKDIKSTLFHEYGHGVFNRMVPSSQKLKWLELYHYYRKIASFSEKKLAGLRKELESCGSLKAFSSTESENAHKALKECLAYAHSKHGVGRKEIELLLEAKQSLAKYWPMKAVDLAEAKLILTEYAKKNVFEFFAEAFALKMLGKNLPKRVSKRMKFTLSHLVKCKA